MARYFGSTRFHFENIESTHLYLMTRGDDLPAGAVVTTDYQTAGRGRRGREWIAARDSSLLASLLVKPNIPAERAPELSHLVALACARVLRCSGVDARIRWPNDLVANGKKLAGILSEARIDGNELRFVVLSVGINLNQTEPELTAIDRPATSLLVETGQRWPAIDIMHRLLAHLDELYSAYLEAGFAAIKAPWEEASSLTGRRISLDVGMQKNVAGNVVGFADDGSIMLDVGDCVRRFAVGEVNRIGGCL